MSDLQLLLANERVLKQNNAEKENNNKAHNFAYPANMEYNGVPVAVEKYKSKVSETRCCQ